MKIIKIAMLGATSHVAKGLILNFCRDSAAALYLFARSAERVKDFLASINCDKRYFVGGLTGFDKEKYDVIINCVGTGAPASLKDAGTSIFELTEKYDDTVLDYLTGSEESVYINFSSGAVYGEEFLSPADVASKNSIRVNEIDSSHYYSIAKLNSEAKHRSYQGLRIIDLRIFAYFSRFIDLKAKYLITEIIKSIKNKSVFRTGDDNIVRDYIGHEDLFSLVSRCIESGTNAAYDVYSRKPVEKFEILKSFHEKFGLNYEISKTINPPGPTGAKDKYYSKNRKAQSLGYEPKYDSLELLIKETEMMLGKGGSN